MDKWRRIVVDGEGIVLPIQLVEYRHTGEGSRLVERLSCLFPMGGDTLSSNNSSTVSRLFIDGIIWNGEVVPSRSSICPFFLFTSFAIYSFSRYFSIHLPSIYSFTRSWLAVNVTTSIYNTKRSRIFMDRYISLLTDAKKKKEKNVENYVRLDILYFFATGIDETRRHGRS